MAGKNPTQKEISEKYKSNFNYFDKGHYYRRLRGWLFALTAVLSVGAVLGFKYWGTDEFFSTGPISENHQRFAHDCKVCHEGAETDLLTLLPWKKASQTFSNAQNFSLTNLTDTASSVTGSAADGMSDTMEKLKMLVANVGEGDKLASMVDKALSYTSLSNIDRACLKCHDAMNLHQPQATLLRLRPISPEIALVHSGACSSCHREHIGHERMKLPNSDSCADCHNDKEAMVRTREVLKTVNPQTPQKGENRDLGDGIVRFLAPPRPGHEVATFKLYSDDHPPFDYEQPNLRDPAVVKYNHWRHEQADIPKLNNRTLDCADCHKPGASGVYYQPINFEEHCQACHSLDVDPELPRLTYPHGDPSIVTTFTRNMALPIADYYRKRGMNEVDLRPAVANAIERLKQRGITTIEELERRVFEVGDPPNDSTAIGPPTNTAQFFPSCSKCHEVSRGDSKTPWRVTPTNMAERWVHRGPFTHGPHQHMSCTDCHGAAKTSKLTSDILMPTQKSCAECHRPLDKEGREKSVQFSQTRISATPGSTDLANLQRREGGIRFDCQSCHVFHAPPAALKLIQAKKDPAPGAGEAKR